MDLDTLVRIVLLIDGMLAVYFMLWIIMVTERGTSKNKPVKEDVIRGEVGKDIFTCPYGHHFLRDEAVIFIDNVKGEYRIYCPRCWDRGRRVLVAREKADIPVIIEAPEASKTEAVNDVGTDVGKVFDDLNVRLRKIEEVMENITRRLEALEKEGVTRGAEETIPVVDEETGEVMEEPVEEPKRKRRRRK